MSVSRVIFWLYVVYRLRTVYWLRVVVVLLHVADGVCRIPANIRISRVARLPAHRVTLVHSSSPMQKLDICEKHHPIVANVAWTLVNSKEWGDFDSYISLDCNQMHVNQHSQYILYIICILNRLIISGKNSLVFLEWDVKEILSGHQSCYEKHLRETACERGSGHGWRFG